MTYPEVQFPMIHPTESWCSHSVCQQVAGLCCNPELDTEVDTDLTDLTPDVSECKQAREREREGGEREIEREREYKAFLCDICISCAPP